jgi:hypothetical protein
MIDWDAIQLLFICTAMNHMGLIAAIEDRIGKKLEVVGCVKCSVFWATLIYGICSSRSILFPAAMAFFYSYTALWLELLMGFVDRLYIKCYEKIVSTAGSDTSAADTDQSDAADALS